MNRKIQIGDFIFRLRCPEEVMTPDNFMLFVCAEDAGKEMYTYDIQVSEQFPEAEGKLIADRPDLKVYEKDGRELRLIGVKGMNGYYACYRETAEDRATVVISRPEIQSLRMDPVFSSLFALEKRLASRAQMVLHCAYVEYKGDAVLFSAPSGTGKTTQAGLWKSIGEAGPSMEIDPFLEKGTADGLRRDGRCAGHRKCVSMKRFLSGLSLC